jgi:hypothetical protein
MPHSAEFVKPSLGLLSMKALYVFCVVLSLFSFVGAIKAFSLEPHGTVESMVTCESIRASAECYNGAGYFVGTYAVVSTKTKSIQFEEVL